MEHDPKPEARLKAAVIDRLFAGEHIDDDAVLVSEMVVENWSRRADVVLANGKLWGFEIKSEADSLARLPGQVEAFARNFEKLVVVVAARFERAARLILPEGVGLWVESSDGSLKERLRPRISPLRKEAAIGLMTASELRHLLACNGAVGIAALQRGHLEQLASYLPATDLANAARTAVKGRHRSRHRAFCEARTSSGTLSAVAMLHRRRAPSKLAPSQDPVPIESRWPLPIPDKHPALFIAPSGPVLRRLPRQ